MISELRPLAAKWGAVGTAFRLQPDTLATIKISHPGDPVACLTEVVTEWLKKNYNSSRFGEPTWQWVVEVVAHPAGGNDSALAAAIGERHSRPAGKIECIVWILNFIVILLLTDSLAHISGIEEDMYSVSISTRLSKMFM